MTWGEFKRTVEARGIRDHEVLAFIDVDTRPGQILEHRHDQRESTAGLVIRRVAGQVLITNAILVENQ